jgi:hypothetical protein
LELYLFGCVLHILYNIRSYYNDILFYLYGWSILNWLLVCLICSVFLDITEAVVLWSYCDNDKCWIAFFLSFVVLMPHSFKWILLIWPSWFINIKYVLFLCYAYRTYFYAIYDWKSNTWEVKALVRLLLLFQCVFQTSNR